MTALNLNLFRKWLKNDDGEWETDDVSGDICGERFLYLPVVVPPKGELFDGFSLSGPDGENISVLSHTEYLRLVAVSTPPARRREPASCARCAPP
jgi:hypothetical protein